ncbi:MAG: hypothetical protein ACM3KR_07825 [Deltaproteobacteria bacterium]
MKADEDLDIGKVRIEVVKPQKFCRFSDGRIGINDVKITMDDTTIISFRMQSGARIFITPALDQDGNDVFIEIVDEPLKLFLLQKVRSWHKRYLQYAEYHHLGY